jgi:hypothetical protein
LHESDNPCPAPVAAALPDEYGAWRGTAQGAQNFVQNSSPESGESLYRRHSPPFAHRTKPAMNAPSELNFEEMLRIRLEVLRREHRDLDEAVHVLETAGRPDPLTLRRLKKQKLALKDQIVKIEDQLIPDIIA